MHDTLPTASNPRMTNPLQWIHGKTPARFIAATCGPEQTIRDQDAGQARRHDLDRGSGMPPAQEIARRSASFKRSKRVFSGGGASQSGRTGNPPYGSPLFSEGSRTGLTVPPNKEPGPDPEQTGGGTRRSRAPT